MKNYINNKYWESKPIWCQPWTIICFGIVFLLCTWKLFNNLILSLILILIIFLWWYIFLIEIPSSYNINDKNN